VLGAHVPAADGDRVGDTVAAGHVAGDLDLAELGGDEQRSQPDDGTPELVGGRGVDVGRDRDLQQQPVVVVQGDLRCCCRAAGI
jgi:hypothetical protein